MAQFSMGGKLEDCRTAMDGLAAGLLMWEEEGHDRYLRVGEGVIDRRYGVTSSSNVDTHGDRSARADSAHVNFSQYESHCLASGILKRKSEDAICLQSRIERIREST